MFRFIRRRLFSPAATLIVLLVVIYNMHIIKETDEPKLQSRGFLEDELKTASPEAQGRFEKQTSSSSALTRALNTTTISKKTCTDAILPYVDQSRDACCLADWLQLPKEEIFRQKKKAWLDFVTNDLRTDKNQPDITQLRSRGIVFLSGSSTLKLLEKAIEQLVLTGTRLPVEVHHFQGELSSSDIERLEKNYRPLQVTVKDLTDSRNAFTLSLKQGTKNFHAKAASILNSQFTDVLFLDSDNLVLRDPNFLFQTDAYKKTGALFWPDFGTLRKIGRHLVL